MRFMNYCDMVTAHRRAVASKDPVRAVAAQFIMQLAEETDAHSDGWAHWPAPCNAAQRMIALADGRTPSSPEAFKRALAPVKAFYTRRGNAASMKFPAASLDTIPARSMTDEVQS